jgi:hypothetical protein
VLVAALPGTQQFGDVAGRLSWLHSHVIQMRISTPCAGIPVAASSADTYKPTCRL